MDLVKVNVNTKEMARVTLKLLGAAEGESRATTMLAALAVAFLVQKPNMAVEELTAAVSAGSEWMALYVTTMGDNTPQKTEIN